MSLAKVVLQHAPKYLTGSVISAGTALVMIKYYTAVFTPAQFGVLALYLVMFQYVTTFVSLNMDSGATRFYFDYRDTKRDEYLSTIFWFITMIATLVLIIGLFSMNFVSNWIAKDSQLIYFVTLITAIIAVYVSFLTRVLYNEQKSTSILKHTLFQTFINHFSSFLLISMFHFGILGRMIGQGSGYLLNTLTLMKEFFTKDLFKLKLQFNKDMAKETFLLSLPTMIGSLQAVIFVYLDRIFIKHYIDDTAVGIYALGFMLGQSLTMISGAISQAILPKVFSDMKNDYIKARDELESFAYKYYIGLAMITVTIAILSPTIVTIISNEKYSEVSTVMPFILAGFMFGGFYKIPSLMLNYHKIVKIYLYIAFISFGINALLNWWLIPIYGIVGASFASFIGVFLYSMILQIISFKYFTVRYKIIIGLTYSLIFIVLNISFIVHNN